MKVVGIVQARTGSRRLPGKVLLPLAGAPILQRLIERLFRSTRMDELVVATTNLSADDPVAHLATDVGASVFRGSELDVLDRVLGAAIAHDADVVVRLTGDNPFVDGSLVDYVLARFLPSVPPIVYAQNIDGSGFPLGLSVEAITLIGLHAATASDEPMDREHVTYFVRRHPDRFPSKLVPSPIALPGTVVTVDTSSQYQAAKDLFEALYAENAGFTFHDVLCRLATRPNPVRASGEST